MSNESRKTNLISKETRDAIKKLLTSNTSQLGFSPPTPTIELDPNFSQILQKKREEQLEASRQRLFEASKLTESTIEHNETERNQTDHQETPVKKAAPVDLDNSMLVGGGNKSFNNTLCSDDSFLALERQCNIEDQQERIINANDTMLFDVEPPAELWNQTVNQTSMMPNISGTSTYSDSESDSDETIEVSPVKYVGMTRPSTIIEETSSQMESSSKAESKVSSTNTTLEPSNESFKSCETSASDSDLSLSNRSISKSMKASRQSRRETFAFKRRNYTFFPDDNLNRIDETASIAEDTENEIPEGDLLEFEPRTPKDETNQFNDTLEAMDYFLEKGRQLIEQTPVTKRDNLQRSVMETPLFSCKRKRILDEMANEMLPLPKRGPLIDFSTPEPSMLPRSSKFVKKL